MKTLILLSILQLGAAGNDAYWTNYNRYERNPIVRPFAGSSRGCAIYFSASAGIHIGGAFWLRKHQHNRLANALLIEGIADHGIAGASSSWQTKQRNR